MLLGAVVLLATAGCADDVAGSATPAGDLPSLEPKSTESTGQEAGFDECVLEPSELAEILDVDAMYVTAREAARRDDGSQRASCTYLPEDVPGVTGMTLSTVVGTDPERFFAPFKKFENVLPIENLGDRAQAVSYGARGSAVHILEIRTITGDRGVHLFYTYREDGGGAMPVLDGGAAQGTLLTQVLDRLPEDVTIPDGAPEGACADLDLDPAAEALGAEFVMSRSVVSDTGGMNCFFGNGQASLTVIVLTDPARVRNWAVAGDEITEQDIGDGARVRVLPAEGGAQGSLDATVNLGDRVVQVSGSYAADADKVTEPRPADLELVRAVIDAIGA